MVYRTAFLLRYCLCLKLNCIHIHACFQLIIKNVRAKNCGTFKIYSLAVIETIQSLCVSIQLDHSPHLVGEKLTTTQYITSYPQSTQRGNPSFFQFNEFSRLGIQIRFRQLGFEYSLFPGPLILWSLLDLNYKGPLQAFHFPSLRLDPTFLFNNNKVLLTFSCSCKPLVSAQWPGTWWSTEDK